MEIREICVKNIEVEIEIKNPSVKNICANLFNQRHQRSVLAGHITHQKTLRNSVIQLSAMN